MSDVKRYKLGWDPSADRGEGDAAMLEDPNGEFVLFSALAELRGDLNVARLQRDAKRCSECPRTDDDLRKRLAEVEAAAKSVILGEMTPDYIRLNVNKSAWERLQKAIWPAIQEASRG